MELVRTKCPYCGKEFLHDIGAQSCFCTHCGKRVILRPVSSNAPNQTRSFHEDQEGEYDSRMQKKLENYEYAKRIGLALVIIASIVTAIGVSADEDFTLNIGFVGMILPFAVEVFFPYPEEWGIVRKAWNVFIDGIGRAILWGLIAAAVFVGMSFILN